MIGPIGLRESLARFAPGDMPPLEHFTERLRSFKDFRSFQRPGFRFEMLHVDRKCSMFHGG